ncbi:MAG: NAD regulator [Rhizobiales bacterium]|nr:NAD regulator [Hyphomicrobiales bacterium]
MNVPNTIAWESGVTAATLEIGLTAAIGAVDGGDPQILTVRTGTASARYDSLPNGPFSPRDHRTLETGLRTWVAKQSGLNLGFVEQLYTFADRGRLTEATSKQPHVVSIGYVALTRMPEPTVQSGGAWRSWYAFFPWEDWRNGKPDIITREMLPRLRDWCESPEAATRAHQPMRPIDRLKICFGIDGASWDEEKALDRYELLYEAGLVREAREDGRPAAHRWADLPAFGQPMMFDHRRILATAMSRLRAKIKYRPVIFEVMPPEFTLFELQRTVEAILGSHLHKQNFRRLVENGGLVVPTGEVRAKTGGRPAKLFRFRREVLLERPAPGVRVHAVNV